MADVNRTRVTYLVLHHAVTPLWQNKSKAELAQWFSDNGFARAYGSNPTNWSGLVNPYTGARSYSQAHYAGQRVDSTTPDATAAEKTAGYRLVPLVKDVWGQITWHAGNWAVNCASIGIENLGDYRNYTLRDGDCKVIAAFWRPHDVSLGGATQIVGHREVSDASTECPARIMEMRDRIVQYCNHPPVAPKPAPIPVKTTFDETIVTTIPYETKTIDLVTEKKGVQIIQKAGVNGTRTVVTRIFKTDGKETGRQVISDVTVPPVTLVMGIGTLTSTTPPVVEQEPPVEQEPIPEPTTPDEPKTPEVEISKWTLFLERIVNLIKKIFRIK